MDAKSRANQSDAVYQEFEPSTRWAREDKFDTLIVHLPGFKKEQLRVQVTTLRKLRIGGQRSLGDNKWSRFQKEFLIDSNYDINEISAKFEGGELHIKHPKIIAQADYKAADAKAEAEAKAKAEAEAKAKAEAEAKAKAEAEAKAKEEAEAKAKAEAEAKAQAEAPKPQKLESDHSKTEQKGKEQEQAREADASKTTSMEKQPSKKASVVKSASDNVDKTASRKESEKRSGEDLSEEGKSTSATEKMEKEKNLEDAAAKAEKEAAGSSNRSRDKFRVEEMKQALCWWVMEMKGQRKLMNMIVAVLLVLVAWVFTKKAVGSLGQIQELIKCNNMY